ncbi:hypothetical protein BC828DRAFT_372774 [Blastocladiella britannica]|nr:hypothetical protein BC828DRAFT_372774 [Blastocladiella britannica]
MPPKREKGKGKAAVPTGASAETGTPDVVVQDHFATLSPWRLPVPNTAELVTLLPDQLYTIDGLLSPTDCQALISAAETHGFIAAQKGARPRKGDAFRDAGRIALDTHQDLAAQMARLLLPVIAREPCLATGCVGLSANVRLYRYDRGGSFGAHYDQTVPALGVSSDVSTAAGTTHFTVLIYLSGTTDDPVVGGETVFYTNDNAKPGNLVAAVAPVQGRALLHRHGDACLLHEGAVVAKGTKYVLRSDLVYSTRSPARGKRK